MNYCSTRSPNALVDFKTALLQGLAPDGGLYLPEHIPSVSKSTWQKWKSLSFVQLTEKLAPLWFGKDLEADLLGRIVRESYTFDLPIRDLGDGRFCCELFHGPSLSFKDIAAQFLMRSLDAILERDNERALILTATSGDTGSAVAAAAHGRDRLRAIILYPRGRVSPIQEQQIATWGDNIQAVSVAGTFDDCQRLVKARLSRPAPKDWHVSSANSINIGRLLPQTFYYWYIALRHPDSVIVVPTGNVGNLCAGVIAQRMGAPIRHFVAASNVNDALPRFLQTGKFAPQATRHTLSNAMDVGAPSNFERLNYLFGGSSEEMKKQITGIVVTDDETRATMHEAWQHHHYLIDPHTAVAWRALSQLGSQFEGHPMVTLATAHPAKFPELIKETTGQTPTPPPSLQTQLQRPLHTTPLDTLSDAALNALLI